MSFLRGKTDEQLEQSLKRALNSIEKMEHFKTWFDTHPNSTLKMIRGQYELIVGGGDWRNHCIRTAKKTEIAEKIQMIHSRTLADFQEVANKVQTEINRRQTERAEAKVKEAVAKTMYTILSKYLETHIMSDREYSCIEGLIDYGYITTAEQLAKYGVEL